MTELFLDRGVPSVKWTDSKNVVHTCTEESYNKIFKQAVKETKSARDHDIEERVDRLQNKEEKDANEEEIKKQEEKQKRLEADKEELRKLDDDELSEMLESLRAEIDELKNPKKDNEKTKSGSREFLGYDSPSKKSYYSVLAYNDSTELHPGDELLQSLGSTD